MRLIDADAFKEMMGNETKARRMVCKLIDTQPTAFNVDKAVEELVDTFGDDICELEGNYECDADIPCDECKRNRMLELVRKGGVE